MMWSESVAILSLYLLIFILLLRKKHPGYAFSVVWLSLLPCAHLLFGLLSFTPFANVFPVPFSTVQGFVDLLATVISVAAIAMFSRKIESLKNRRIYLFSLIGYSVLLGWAYLLNNQSFRNL